MHQTNLFETKAAEALASTGGDRFAMLAPADLSDGEKESVIQLALRVLEPAVHYDAFTDTESAKRFLRLPFARAPYEIFACAYLDTRNRLIEPAELFHGTIDGCSVHPRVVSESRFGRRDALNPSLTFPPALFVPSHRGGRIAGGRPERCIADQGVPSGASLSNCSHDPGRSSRRLRRSPGPD